jgi:hypothetical protein
MLPSETKGVSEPHRRLAKAHIQPGPRNMGAGSASHLKTINAAHGGQLHFPAIGPGNPPLIIAFLFQFSGLALQLQASRWATNVCRSSSDGASRTRWMWAGPHDLPCWLVQALTLIRDLLQEVVVGPRRICPADHDKFLAVEALGFKPKSLDHRGRMADRYV